MTRTVQSFSGALLVWACATLIEAIAYQVYRLLLASSFEWSWFLSVLSRYLLFRLAYSLAPVLMGAALIHAYRPSIGWAYVMITASSLIVPLYFTLWAETPLFDPAIIGFCLATMSLIYLMRFKRKIPGF